MYWDYIRHGDFPCRSRCSQVAVLSFNLPESVKTGHPGRPKFDTAVSTKVVQKIVKAYAIMPKDSLGNTQ